MRERGKKMRDKVVDELGLVQEGQCLVVFIPISQKAFVFFVRARRNRAAEEMPYGPLPLKTDTTLPTYDGSSETVPEDGVLPARAYTSEGIQFPLDITGIPKKTDMWFIPSRMRDTLFHVKTKISPDFIRIDTQIPPAVTQSRFQKTNVIIGISAIWGYSRGTYEIAHIPELIYGYRFGNDTNLDLYSYVQFTYGEYDIQIPNDATFVFDVLIGKTPAYWLSLPIVGSYDPAIKEALTKTYGIEGFDLPAKYERAELLEIYEVLLEEKKI